MDTAVSMRLFRWDVLQRSATAVAIVALPLLGFFADRAYDEPITGFMGSALYALYALGLIAYVATISGRLPQAVSSAAAGVLGVGALVSVVLGLVGIFAALFTLLLLLMAGTQPSLLMRLAAIAAGLLVLVGVLSPWFTAFALGHLSLRTLQWCAAHAGRVRTIAWGAVGAALIIVAMVAAQKVHDEWLTSRRQAFRTGDVVLWKQALQDIKANWLCGRRRCLAPICMELMGSFGRTAGEDGFAPILGFAIEAPRIPANLAEPFTKVYGRPVTQVCAVGD